MVVIWSSSGSGQTVTPLLGSISLIKVTPYWASPVATACATPVPLGFSTALARTSCADAHLVGLLKEKDTGDAAGGRIDIGDGLGLEQRGFDLAAVGNGGFGRTQPGGNARHHLRQIGMLRRDLAFLGQCVQHRGGADHQVELLARLDALLHPAGGVADHQDMGAGRGAEIGGQGPDRHGHAGAGEDFQVLGVGGGGGQQKQGNRNKKANHTAFRGAYVLLRARRPRFIRAGRQSEGEKKMKTGFLASAAIAASLLVSAQANAADYTTILLEKVVNRTPDQTWAKIGPYCAIATWLKVTCVITAGNGVSVGSNRLLNGNNNEIMVAMTPYSYSYTQPSSTILYHGTLAVEPLDRGRQTRIVYTLFYDQAPLEHRPGQGREPQHTDQTLQRCAGRR